MSLRRRDLDSKELWQEYDLHTMEHGASSIDDDGENVKGKEKVLHSGSVRSGLVALYACVFLDLVSVGLVIPLLPYYAEALGASPSEYGALLSFYGILQLFGSPLMGKVSDVFGRKVVLIASLVAGAISYGCMPFAYSLPLLFACRIPVGIVKQTMTTANAIVADLTKHEDRARFLGYVSTAISAGLVAGPMIGGMLSSISMDYPAFAAGGIYLVNIIMVVVYLPSSNSQTSVIPPTAAATISAVKTIGLRSVEKVVSSTSTSASSALMHVMLVQFLSNLANITFRSTLQQFTMMEFQLDARENGFLLSYISALQSFVQAVLVGILTARISEPSLISSGTLIQMMTMVAMPVAPGFYGLLAILVPCTLASDVSDTCLTSMVTKNAKSESLGGVLGLSGALASLCRAVSPYIGGLLIQFYGPAAAPLSVAAILAVQWIVVVSKRLTVATAPPIEIMSSTNL